MVRKFILIQTPSPGVVNIPLSGRTGTNKHRCSAKPFNKHTRRRWWRSQEYQQQQWRQQHQQQQQQKTTVPERIKKHLVVLGLSSLCNLDEVKRAYRKLALLYHPDRSNDASTTAKFIEIQEAYEKCVKELSPAATTGEDGGRLI